MVKTVGPASGSKGQVGFREESKWGYPASPPNKFIEFTSEGITSDFTSLVSASLRADRAIHKQRTGTESAGGDLNFELGPEGFGTLLKHALGKKRTKRVDIAFVLVYGGTDTDRIIRVESNSLVSTGTTGSDDLNYTLSSYTHQSIITALDGETNWSCYVAWGDGTDTANGGYFARSLANKASSSSTLGASDYTVSGNLTAASLELFDNASVGVDADANGYVFVPISFSYGIYEHTLDADPDLPQGMTLEIGRDIAAFNYYGAMVNTLALTLNPGEMITGTVNFMCKGASTVGDPAVSGSNTGWAAPVCDIRYAGSEASANVELDMGGTRDMFYFEHGGSGTEEVLYHFSLERGYFDHSGYYWEVNTVGGFLEFLEEEAQAVFSVTRKGGVAISTAATSLSDSNLAVLATDSDTTFTLDADVTIAPLFRGNYIGTDAGESISVYVDVTTGGACDGTAAFKGQKTGDGGWSAAQNITAGIWYDVFDGSDIDTGFDVMWPENVTLTVDDTWVVTSFKDENASASYETEDVFTGFQGALQLDMGAGAGLEAQGVMGLAFTLNNNLFGDKFELGDRQRAAIIPQRRATEGTQTTEFDNLDLYRMFVNQVAGDLRITLTSDEYVGGSSTKHSLQIIFPNIKYSGTTPVVGGEELIQTDFPFTALYDDAASIPDCRMVLTNGQSYI
jgi:hypothetical protein